MSTRLGAILIIGATLLLGLLRLILDVTPTSAINHDAALRLARCFDAQHEIPAGQTVTLRPVPGATYRADTKPLAAKAAIEFTATASVPIQLVDPTTRAAFDKKELTKLPAGTLLRVSKGIGAFVFHIEDAMIEVQQSGRRYLFETRFSGRFEPIERATYIVQLRHEVPVQGEPATAALPPGTQGQVDLGSGLSFALSQPLFVAPWIVSAPPTLFPERASGQKGLTNLTIEARQPGLSFDTPGLRLGACVGEVAASAVDQWHLAGAAVTPRASGTATILLSLPPDILPVFSSFSAPVQLVLATADGQYAGYGGFTYIDRGWAAVIAVLFTVGLFGWLLSLCGRELSQSGTKQTWMQWSAGLFIGNDNDLSLSLFQVFFWTVVTVWGLVYVFTVTGSLLSMTTEMMGLLGLAGAGSVAARWIATSTAAGSTSQPRGVAAAPEPDIRFWRMLSTEGRFDLLKLQLFVFTLLIGAYVVWRIADTAAFPQLDTNTLLLMGVSQSVYIGGKLAGTTSLSRAQTVMLDLENRKKALQILQDAKNQLVARQTSLTNLGVQVSPAEAQELSELPAAIQKKDQEIQEATAPIAALQIKYDDALKELKLVTI